MAFSISIFSLFFHPHHFLLNNFDIFYHDFPAIFAKSPIHMYSQLSIHPSLSPIPLQPAAIPIGEDDIVHPKVIDPFHAFGTEESHWNVCNSFFTADLL